MSEEIWRALAEIHNNTKAITLLVEEIDPKNRIFLPGVMEQRDAYTHIMRAKTSELGLIPGKKPDAEYVLKNLDKALGHEYRAFFDVADFLAIAFRQKIREAMTPFSPESIDAVLPSYYTKVRPAIESICREVAAIRASKDIGDGNRILEQVRKYREIIARLGTYWEQVVNAQAVLLERERKTRRSRSWTVAREIIIAVLAAIAGAVAAWYLK